jgi:hypothetical protein
MTAVRIFDREWRKLEPIDIPSSPPVRVDEMIARATENDLVNDDLSVFPDWKAGRSQGGWIEFRSNGRRLFVKNVNVSTVETSTGADLVYWRADSDSFVIVQYKKLEYTEDGGFFYRIDDRLSGQVQRLLQRTSPAVSNSCRTHDNYRLTDVSAFVKFVAPLERHADDELIPGYYVPADLMKLFGNLCNKVGVSA